MLALILLSILAGANAQFATFCECALFNSLQIQGGDSTNAIPLVYYGQFTVNEDQCSKQPGTVNDCMILCQQEFGAQGGLQADLCTRTNGLSPRCTGSQWCETLYNNGIKDVSYLEGSNDLYYRMVLCEGTEFVNWQYGFREVGDDGLCCNNGQFSHCTVPCEGACEANNLCECGAFVASQFDEERLNVTGNPLPLYNVGTEWGPGGQFACENWPGPDFGHPCDTSCLTASQFFKNNRALNDAAPQNPNISLGQYYCQVLKTRWADQWPANGIGPEDIQTFARMPGCDKNDGTNDHLKWNTERRYTCHHQALCCDGDGNRYQCEGGTTY